MPAAWQLNAAPVLMLPHRVLLQDLVVSCHLLDEQPMPLGPSPARSVVFLGLSESAPVMHNAIPLLASGPCPSALLMKVSLAPCKPTGDKTRTHPSMLALASPQGRLPLPAGQPASRPPPALGGSIACPGHAPERHPPLPAAQPTCQPRGGGFNAISQIPDCVPQPDPGGEAVEALMDPCHLARAPRAASFPLKASVPFSIPSLHPHFPPPTLTPLSPMVRLRSPMPLLA